MDLTTSVRRLSTVLIAEGDTRIGSARQTTQAQVLSAAQAAGLALTNGLQDLQDQLDLAPTAIPDASLSNAWENSALRPGLHVQRVGNRVMVRGWLHNIKDAAVIIAAGETVITSVLPAATHTQVGQLITNLSLTSVESQYGFDVTISTAGVLAYAGAADSNIVFDETANRPFLVLDYWAAP